MTEILGQHLYITALKLQGVRLPAEMQNILQEVVGLAGMQTGGLAPAVWSYPLPGGGGGLGSTICQPLIESFCISDDWPELGHTFIILASCRRYSVQAVLTFLAETVGPVVALKILEF
jgi:hypothetical protein